jgi:hypothetical protein
VHVELTALLRIDSINIDKPTFCIETKQSKLKSFCFRNDVEKLAENLNADIKTKLRLKKTNEGFISEYTMKRLSIKNNCISLWRLNYN